MVYTILQRDIVFLQGRILIGGPREPPQEMKREREREKKQVKTSVRLQGQDTKEGRERRKRKNHKESKTCCGENENDEVTLLFPSPPLSCGVKSLFCCC